MRAICRDNRNSPGTGSGFPDPVKAQQRCRVEADAQAPEDTWLRTAGCRHGQAAILRFGVQGTWTVGETRAGIEEEQSGRELSSAGPATRTKNAVFQVTRISSALSLYPRRRLQQLQRPASPDFPIHAPRLPGRSNAELGQCRRNLICS